MNRHEWQTVFVQEAQRALPLLEAWHEALVRRNLPQIDALTARILPVLERIEEARALCATNPVDGAPAPLSDRQMGTDTQDEAVALALRIDQIVQSAYDIILNELEYTHGLMALLVRASEPEHYAPTDERPLPNLLVNTEA